MTDSHAAETGDPRLGRSASGKKALGKGLGALIGESRAALGRMGSASPLNEGRLRELHVEDISVNPRQPRRGFSDEDLEELAASIKSLGVVQPVVVRPLQGADLPDEGMPARGSMHFELIAGERRLRAAKLAGLDHIPALVRPADEVASLEIALAENVARENLNSIEEALAYASLVDEFGLTHERIAQLVGRSRAAVSNLLRLLDLPDEVQTMVEAGELSEGHGRALLGLSDHGERRRVARLAVSKGMTVREVEALVRASCAEEPVTTTPTTRPATDFTELSDELYGLLGSPVRIRSGKRGGSIRIGFRDAADLQRIVKIIRSLG